MDISQWILIYLLTAHKKHNLTSELKYVLQCYKNEKINEDKN